MEGNISKKEAIEIILENEMRKITERFRSMEDKLTDVMPNVNVYGLPRDEEGGCWYLRFTDSPIGVIASSRLIVVSKKTRKIIYDDSANDEG